ncbi:MAG: NTP transferase domain-containing protein [Desulfobulbaceae bacterium]|jgi:bifunctional UDP-N-acetylglucosamine pyrophosphorylase/glucosamine-1-phosphate N-acetyltransferase|nr:NTP transferase domain-containing protein [Desulfobulbaceae bacterium]
MNIAAIVLAAGKGTRMKSFLPKVLHPVFYSPMICHVLDSLQALNLTQTIVVTGHKRQLVEETIAEYQPAFVFQEDQNGTGHAVQLTEQILESNIEHVLIVCGDSPLISADTLQLMIDEHQDSQSDVTVLSTVVDDPSNYGRMVCDAENRLLAIIEEKDATLVQKDIREINGGIYIVRKEVLFSSLEQVNSENAQGEVYLTDIVGIANNDGHNVSRVICENPLEIMGVNSRKELMEAHDIMQDRFFDQLLDHGVTVMRRSTSSIHPTATLGQDTTIYSNVSIDSNVIIGSFCQIHDQCYIKDSYIGENVIIGAASKLIGANIPANSIVKPGSIMIFANDMDAE